MLRGDGPVPEDRALHEEGRLRGRLHLPAAQHHAHEPRAGHAVLTDVGAGRRAARRHQPGGSLAPNAPPHLPPSPAHSHSPSLAPASPSLPHEPRVISKSVCIVGLYSCVQMFATALAITRRLEHSQTNGTREALYYIVMTCCVTCIRLTNSWTAACRVVVDDAELAVVSDRRRLHGVEPDPAVHVVPARRPQEQPAVGGSPADPAARDEPDARPSGTYPSQLDMFTPHGYIPLSARHPSHTTGRYASRLDTPHTPRVDTPLG